MLQTSYIVSTPRNPLDSHADSSASASALAAVKAAGLFHHSIHQHHHANGVHRHQDVTPESDEDGANYTHDQVNDDDDRDSVTSSSSDEIMSSKASESSQSTEMDLDTTSSSLSSASPSEEPIKTKTVTDVKSKDGVKNSLKEGLSILTMRPTSALPSLSLLYPDTAPRSAWRPQLDAWMKKNHPSKLKEIVQVCSPLPPPPAPTSTTTTHLSARHNHEPSSTVGTKSTGTGSSHLSASAGHGATSTSLGSGSSSSSGTTAKNNNNYQHQYLYHANSGSGKASSQYVIPVQRKDRRASHDSKPYAKPFTHKPSTAGSTSNTVQSSSNVARLPSPPESPKNYSGEANLGSRRRCISCGSDQSPCWRPSWSSAAGQLCNSCGLRYKKTGARCVSSECRRIPAKGEWVIIKNAAVRINGKLQYNCLTCGGEVEVGGSL